MAGRDRLEDVPVARVRASKTNPRQRFDDAEMKELIESIREHGLDRRIIVRPAGDSFEIVDGERRWRAHKALNRKTIPATVRELSDVEAHASQVRGFLQSKGITILEEAHAIKALQDLHRLTIAQLQAHLNVSERTVHNRLALLKLPEKVLWEVGAGRLPPTHAQRIAGLPKAAQKKALREIMGGEKVASKRETEAIARKHRNRLQPPRFRPKAPRYEVDLHAIREVVRKLGQARPVYGLILDALITAAPEIGPGLAAAYGIKGRNDARAARRYLTEWLARADEGALRCCALEAALRLALRRGETGVLMVATAALGMRGKE